MFLPGGQVKGTKGRELITRLPVVCWVKHNDKSRCNQKLHHRPGGGCLERPRSAM